MKRFNEIWIFLLIFGLVGCCGKASPTLPDLELPDALRFFNGEMIHNRISPAEITDDWPFKEGAADVTELLDESAFVFTGLPAGESARVLEYTALQIDSGASFVVRITQNTEE